jgi:acyl carrier protein phosphodiesterase
MNYLAHAFLSYNEPMILVGNMISDFVKGRQKFGYAVSVQKGMMLHRAIDSFYGHPSCHGKSQRNIPAGVPVVQCTYHGHSL